MKKIFSILLLVAISSLAAQQQDTIVLADYTKVMVGSNPKGGIYPITSLEQVSVAGFFLNALPEVGKIRVCPQQELAIWVNGRLFDTITECHYYEPSALFDLAKSDTIFVALSSKTNLSGITCDLVTLRENQVIRDSVAIPREVNKPFEEFVIISLLLLAILLGIILSRFSSRVFYILGRAFTFKVSAYEFVNTNFLSSTSMYFVTFYSFALAFTGLYLDQVYRTGFFGELHTTLDFIWVWVKLAALIFSLFIAKWILISIIAKLFHFRGLKNFQLFDFVNFNTVFLTPLVAFLTLDFIVNPPGQSWVGPGLLIIFPTALILFVIWFTFKFVNNSPRKKLMIISYLCATEIIPLIILLGFFYK